MAQNSNGRDVPSPQPTLASIRQPFLVPMVWSPKWQRCVLTFAGFYVVLMVQNPNGRGILLPTRVSAVLAETCSLAPAGSNQHQMTFPRSEWHKAPNSRDTFSCKPVPQMTFMRSKWHEAPNDIDRGFPSANKTAKFSKSPKDQKARNKTKPKAKNNSTQTLIFLSIQKKISPFYGLYNLNKLFILLF